MSMTREEAIKWLEEIIQDTDTYWESCSEALQKELDEQKDVFDIALSALRPVSREQVERMRATLEPTTLPDGTKTVATKCSECGAHNLITHLFCWRCGSPLTDVAVDILVRRLEEALKDGD